MSSTRLELLDLGDNEITEVNGLHLLPAMVELQLDANSLKDFPSERSETCPRLQRIDLARNRLEHLSIDKHFPSLTTVVLDNNSLSSSTTAFCHLKRLDTLSLRSQSSQTPLSLLPTSLPDISNLHLSLNSV